VRISLTFSSATIKPQLACGFFLWRSAIALSKATPPQTKFQNTNFHHQPAAHRVFSTLTELLAMFGCHTIGTSQSNGYASLVLEKEE
jgi:hypothetical protein